MKSTICKLIDRVQLNNIPALNRAKLLFLASDLETHTIPTQIQIKTDGGK